MELKDLDRLFLEATSSLDVTVLHEIDTEVLYSSDDKQQFIEVMEQKFMELKRKEMKRLYFEDSVCNFCYPRAKAYDFFDWETDGFAIRYVVSQNSESDYVIEECKNRKMLPNADGLPF